jgi:hypothetical protein
VAVDDAEGAAEAEGVERAGEAERAEEAEGAEGAEHGTVTERNMMGTRSRAAKPGRPGTSEAAGRPARGIQPGIVTTAVFAGQGRPEWPPESPG